MQSSKSYNKPLGKKNRNSISLSALYQIRASRTVSAPSRTVSAPYRIRTPKVSTPFHFTTFQNLSNTEFEAPQHSFIEDCSLRGKPKIESYIDRFGVARIVQLNYSRCPNIKLTEIRAFENVAQ